MNSLTFNSIVEKFSNIDNYEIKNQQLWFNDLTFITVNFNNSNINFYIYKKNKIANSLICSLSASLNTLFNFKNLIKEKINVFENNHFNNYYDTKEMVIYINSLLYIKNIAEYVDFNIVLSYIKIYGINFYKYITFDFIDLDLYYFTCIDNLLELQIKRDLLYEKKNNIKNIENQNILFDNEILNMQCPICFTQFKDDIDNLCSLSCSHLFCIICIKKTESNKCPLCRAQFLHESINTHKILINLLKNDKNYINYTQIKNDNEELIKINDFIEIIKNIINYREKSIDSFKERINEISL